MTQLPADISPSFAPTAQTLWAVWGRRPYSMVVSGWAEAIYQAWIIASPGGQGLQEIRKQMPAQFLAAAPLDYLSNARLLLEQSGAAKFAGLWPTWLPFGSKESFFLSAKPDGGHVWGFGVVDKLDPQERAKVAIEAPLKDFIDLHDKGREILATQDYKSILADAREASPGHPQDWFDVM